MFKKDKLTILKVIELLDEIRPPANKCNMNGLSIYSLYSYKAYLLHRKILLKLMYKDVSADDLNEDMQELELLINEYLHQIKNII